MNLVSFSLVLAGVLLNAAAQLFLKEGMRRIGHFEFVWDNFVPIALQVSMNVFVLAGLVCYVVSVLIWIMALSRVEVSIAYPMLSIGYVVNAAAAWYLFGEAVTAQRMVGIATIIVGVFLVARS